LSARIDRSEAALTTPATKPVPKRGPGPYPPMARPIFSQICVGRPVSRVLSSAEAPRRSFLSGDDCSPLLAVYPDDGLEAALRRSTAIPIRPCSRWGLPCLPRCRASGALLPHPFTLTLHAERFTLCGAVPEAVWSAPPGVTRHRAFMEPGLSSNALLRGVKRTRPSSLPTRRV